MSGTAKKSSATKVITPKAILSYPNLFKPQAAEEGQTPKYSAAFIFEEGSDLTGVVKAIEAAATDKFGEKGLQLLRAGKLASPLRADPDDVEEKGYPKGSSFFNARTNNPPGIVSVFPGPDGKPLAITNEKEVYAGCIVRASITAFYYDRAGKKGIGLALNNVQKLSDGKRLDGRKAAQDEFDADLSAAPANIDDLMNG